MLSSWSVDTLSVFTQERETFPLVPGTESYTIGSGADFNTVKPLKIVAAYVNYGGYDYPLDEDGSKEYSNIYDKDLTGTPSRYNYNPNSTIGTLNIWPAPSSAMDLHLYSEKALTAFPDLTTDITLAEGYKRAIIYNLAPELAPMYQVEPTPTTMRIARESKSIIKKYNSRRDALESSLSGIPQARSIGGNINNGWLV